MAGAVTRWSEDGDAALYRVECEQGNRKGRSWNTNPRWLRPEAISVLRWIPPLVLLAAPRPGRGLGRSAFPHPTRTASPRSGRPPHRSSCSACGLTSNRPEDYAELCCALFARACLPVLASCCAPRTAPPALLWGRRQGPDPRRGHRRGRIRGGSDTPIGGSTCRPTSYPSPRHLGGWASE